MVALHKVFFFFNILSGRKFVFWSNSHLSNCFIWLIFHFWGVNISFHVLLDWASLFLKLSFGAADKYEPCKCQPEQILPMLWNIHAFQQVQFTVFSNIELAYLDGADRAVWRWMKWYEERATDRRGDRRRDSGRWRQTSWQHNPAW